MPFTLDKANGKLMGVCAGLSRSSGLDATLLRILALLALFASGGTALLVYIAAGLIAPQRA